MKSWCFASISTFGSYYEILGLVIVCSELPDELPTGDVVVDGVSVTGYFFKMYLYQAGDTTRRAPLVLAKTVQFTPTMTTVADVPEWLPYGAVVVVSALFCGLMVLLLRSRWHDRQMRDQRNLRSLEQPTDLNELQTNANLTLDDSAPPSTPIAPDAQ